MASYRSVHLAALSGRSSEELRKLLQYKYFWPSGYSPRLHDHRVARTNPAMRMVHDDLPETCGRRRRLPKRLMPPLAGAHPAERARHRRGLSAGCRPRCISPKRASMSWSIDAHQPGWGASGRNGGQVIPGLKYDPGRARGDVRPRTRRAHLAIRRRHRRLSCSISSHGIGLDCDARRSRLDPGHPFGEGVGPRAAARRRIGSGAAPTWRIPRRDREPPPLPAPTSIAAASIDRRAGRLQPLSYARELARVASASVRGSRGDASAAGARAGTTPAGSAVTVTTARRSMRITCSLRPTRMPMASCRGWRDSIVALNSLQIATAAASRMHWRRTMLPNGEVALRHAQGHPLLAARRRGSPADGRARALPGTGRRSATGRISRGRAGPSFPLLRDAPLHASLGRARRHPHRLHAAPAPAAPGLLVAIGCQGRGIGWQTAMGAELARRALDRALRSGVAVLADASRFRCIR